MEVEDGHMSVFPLSILLGQRKASDVFVLEHTYASVLQHKTRERYELTLRPR
jgi:hypothetical protein